jgi:hypothetical protein
MNLPAKRARLSRLEREEFEPDCVMETRCPVKHAATACRHFRSMPPQHRRALAKKKELCLACLTHDTRTSCSQDPAPGVREEWRQEHWLMTRQYNKASVFQPAQLPLVSHLPGRQVYQCRLSLCLRASEGAREKPALRTLFNDKADRTVIDTQAALDRNLPSVRVAATRISVPGLDDRTCDRIFFIDVFVLGIKDTVSFISAWGFPSTAIKSSAGAPELELVRHPFGHVTRQGMEEFVQPGGVIDLLIGQDYAKWFPTITGRSKEDKDDLYFLKTCLLPRGIIYGEAAVGLKEERRDSFKRASRESSGASACREPNGDEQGEQRGQTVEKDMLALFGSPISSSSE